MLGSSSSASMPSGLNDMFGVLSMDEPIRRRSKSQQRPAKEQSNGNKSSSFLNQSILGQSLSKSFNKSLNGSISAKGSRTPGKSTNSANGNTRKTPSKGAAKSPSKSKTPTWGDRFIPNRSATDYDLANYLISKKDEDEENESNSQSQRDRKVMSENLFGGDVSNRKVMQFGQKAPTSLGGNSMRMIYDSARTPSLKIKSTTRVIPTMPEKILDAPDIMDDYYLNLIDWGKHNILAVALRNAVYLWNEATGQITQLMELTGAEEFVSSVSWIQEGQILAVGNSTGAVQLWDCNQIKQVRTMWSHTSRVGSLSWNMFVLSSGSRLGSIHHHDVRAANFLVAESNAHSQEVCGLKWSPDGNFLASGANDNLLHIWPRAPSDMHGQATPIHTFNAHQAAVKALAWCPWQNGVLASGGGTADRHIRFWNIRTGSSISAIDTKSQVCSLLWSTEYKEIVSGHGYSNHEINVWKFPTMDKIAELTGHTQRVLTLCLSPDGQMVLSAGADETIRLWNIFPKDPKKKTATTNSTKAASSALVAHFR
ncbi:cell division cycle protein 20 homolog isoform X2 [Neocloeon triangulifer]|uniref:cell division cycle protein 20 homolog isoform X2 n=1 Tax=Neocloeon triangulifer TaxID=2078957 RepID=UPI00286FA6EE|nr:cell division cycle protein 20 homolog isoform X2 [Neocloeon triangulifer]